MDKPAFMKQFQLLLSSLFKRKPRWLLTGCRTKDDTPFFIHTNRHPQTLFHKFNSEDVVHHVTVKDKEFIDQLYDLYPALYSYGFIDLQTLIAAINKTVNILESKIEIKDGGFYYQATSKEKKTREGQIKEPSVEMDLCVGSLCTEFDINRYIATNKQWDQWQFDEDVFIAKVPLHEIGQSDISLVQLTDADYGSLEALRSINVSFLDGMTNVSVHEYYKKSQHTPEYKAILKDVSGRGTLQMLLVHDDELVRVETYRPSMQWFVVH